MGTEGKRKFDKHPIKTAILVDGGFYRKRAKSLWGNKTPAERANELIFPHWLSNIRLIK